MTKKSNRFQISLLIVLAISIISSLVAKEIYFENIIGHAKWDYYQGVLNRRNVNELKQVFHFTDNDIDYLFVNNNLSSEFRERLILDRINSDGFWRVNYLMGLYVITFGVFGIVSLLGTTLVILLLPKG